MKPSEEIRLECLKQAALIGASAARVSMVHAPSIVDIADVFEDYVRNGKKEED